MEDLRILAVAVGVAGKTDDAARMLRDVIEQATEHARPMLVAAAQRDLAYLWARHGDVGPAKEMARMARAAFHRLGSKVEIEKMTALLTQPHPGAPRIGLADPAPSAVDLDAVPKLRDTTITKRETIGPA